MSDPITDKIIKNIGRTYELALEFGDDDSKNENVYLEMVRDLCQYEADIERCRKALEKAKEGETEESFDSIYAEEKSKRKSTDGKKLKRYKDFQDEIKRMLEDANRPITAAQSMFTTADCEVEATEPISYIDPISKRPLENPVRNKRCNHVYGRETITETLKLNPSMRCPIVGCPNKTFVQLNDLEDDHEMKRLLLQKSQNTNP